MDARRSRLSTDGRRRRLLQQNDEIDLLAEFESLRAGASADPAPQVTLENPDRFLIGRLISPRRWKHGLVLAGTVLLTAAVAFSEMRRVWLTSVPASAWAAGASRPLAGIFMLLAGQLALLIGWVRSRSPVDFSGRYRCWKWLAAFLAVSGVLWITGWHGLLPDLACLAVEPLIGPVGAGRAVLVVVPAAALSLGILIRIIPDMGRNRWTQFLVCVAAVQAGIWVLSGHHFQNTESPQIVADAVLLLASGTILSALLLHARFVLYVSKDPPETASASRRTDTDREAGKLSAESPRTDADAGDVIPAEAKSLSAAESNGSESDASEAARRPSPKKADGKRSAEKKRKKRRHPRPSRRAA